MTFRRFEPWSVVDLLHRDLNRLVQNRQSYAEGEEGTADWTPAVDIVEEPGQFVLRADLPGVKPEDIDVSMDGGILTVSGHREPAETPAESSYQRIERAHGRFVRRFSLPESANAEDIAARSNNGILEVTIPKQPEIRARRITVESD